MEEGEGMCTHDPSKTGLEGPKVEEEPLNYRMGIEVEAGENIRQLQEG